MAKEIKPQENPSASGLSGFAIYKRLFKYVWPYKWGFVVAICGMFVVSGGDAGFAMLIRPIIDQGFVGRDAGFIFWIPIFLLLLGAVRGIGNFVDIYCMRWVSAHVVQDLRQLMFAQMLRAPIAYYDKNPSGDLSAKILFNVEQVAMLTSTAFRTAVRDFFKLMFLLVWMFVMSWKLSLLFAVIVPLAFYIFKLSSRLMREMSTRVQDNIAGISTLTTEAMKGHRAVKIFDAYQQEQDAFHKAANRDRHLRMKGVAIMAAASPLMVFLSTVGTAGVVWIALLSQDITPGIFASYLTSMVMLAQPLRSLSTVNMRIQMGLAAAESVFASLDLPIEDDSGEIELKDIKNEIKFEQVSFHYPDHENIVLKDANINIKAGSTVALVGVSGSGKSTIVSLLLRFYAPDKGQISIDGTPLDEFTLKSLRANSSIVPQEIVLFDDTIANNISYGGIGSDQQRVLEAAAAANVLEFAEDMPQGLDTVIGEDGVLLSGGQRQRIAIARALYKNSPLLIMDEATSSLDMHSERHIKTAIARLVKNRTSIIIAHRLSTIENADLILVLDAGKIVQQGTHAELIKKDGAYAKLQKAQSG